MPQNVALQTSSTDQQPEVRIKHAPQGEVLYNFAQSDAFVQCIIGPIGSAKTSEAILKLLRLINEMPAVPEGERLVRRSRVLILRNTQVDLKSTTIKDWERLRPKELTVTGKMSMDSPITDKLKWKHSDGMSYVEAEVMFVGFDALGDVKKLRGYQLTHLWADEAKELSKEVVDMAIGRLGRFPEPTLVEYKPHALLTSNAPAGDEWLALLERDRPDGYEFFIQPGGVIKVNGKWVMNPKGENVANLQPDYYSRQIPGKKDSWVRQNLANEFVVVSDGRPVHPDFSQSLHVSDYELEPSGGLPISFGADWGRTPAAAVVQFQPNGRLMVLDEVTTVNTGIPAFGRAVKRLLNERYNGLQLASNYGDPSGTSFGYRDESCFDLMDSEGLFVEPAPTNDPDVRFAALDWYLTNLIDGEPAIVISPRCKMLIRGLAGGYGFKRLQVAGHQAMYQDKPNKTPESHVCESLHYVLCGHGGADKVMMSDSSAWAKEFDDVETWHPNQTVYE